MPAGSTYTPIATTTLSSNTLTFTFSSIPSTYTDLVLVSNAKSTQTGTASNGMRVNLNNDTGTNYSETVFYGDGTTASTYRATNQGYIVCGDLPQTSNTAWNANIIHFMNYANTTTFKSVLTRANIATVNTVASVHLWRSTSAITSISITRDGTNFIAAGSTFTLYGITAA